jgi:hypothetical protein
VRALLLPTGLYELIDVGVRAIYEMEPQ